MRAFPPPRSRPAKAGPTSCFGAGLLLAAGLASQGVSARDLTVVSWGGSYQDAQKAVYFQPFVQAPGTAAR